MQRRSCHLACGIAARRRSAALNSLLASRPSLARILPTSLRCPSLVFESDSAPSPFDAAPVGPDGRVLEDERLKLPRLSVMFLLERVADFTTRVARSHAARDECEGQLLMAFYIKLKNSTTCNKKPLETYSDLPCGRLFFVRA